MRSQAAPEIGCPTDEELGAFVERCPSGEDRARVEVHVSGCTTCLDVVASLLPESPMGSDVGLPAALRPRDVLERAPSRWHRWAVAAGLVLVGSVALLALLRQPLVDRLGPGLTRLATRWLGTAVQGEVAAVRLGPTPGTFVVALRDLKIGGDLGMFARADEVGLTVALAAPMFGSSAISRLRVVGPVLEVPGPDSFALAWSARARAQVLALLSQSDRVDLVEGRFIVREATGRAFVVDHVTGGLERTTAGVRFALQGQAASGTMDVVGTLDTEDERLTVTVSGRDLDAAGLPLLTRRLAGTTDLRLDLTSRGDEMRADGRIAVRKGRLVGGGPSRVLALDGATTARLAESAPSLVGEDLAFDEARAIFAWRDGTMRLPRVFLTAGSAVAGGRGRIAADGDLSGQGTVQLPSEVVGSLAAGTSSLEGFRDATGAAILPFVLDGTMETPRFALGRP